MQLRSRADNANGDLSQAPDSEPPAAQRRSSRLRKPSRQFLDSDDEENAKPFAQRQLNMQIADEVRFSKVSTIAQVLPLKSSSH